MKTKKELVVDAIFLIALALVVSGLIVSIAISGKSAEATCEPTTQATTAETTEYIPEPTQEETIVVEVAEPFYTKEELEHLALAIYQEAGGDSCTDETRLMVGTVVMNRVADPRFPDTIEEVLTQKRQYGRLYWTGLVWAERASNPNEAHAVKRAYECAKKILSGYRAFSEDVIWQAEFIQGSEIVAYQDGIYFCK